MPVPEWKALIFPRLSHFDSVLQARVMQLEELQELASQKVRVSAAEELVRSARFWSSPSATARLSHPWSKRWVARRGGIWERTLRSELREFELCVEAQGVIERAIHNGSSSGFLADFAAVASIVLERASSIRYTEVATRPDSEGHQLSFAPYRSVPRLLNSVRDRYAESDLPRTAANVVLLASILNVHPLEDGNGRCARAFFNALNARAPNAGGLYLPLRVIIEISEGGFEIRVRDAERNGNWLPLIDYFISIYRFVIDELDPTENDTGPSPLKKNTERPELGAIPNERVYGMLHSTLEDMLRLSDGMSPFLSSGEAGHALAMADASRTLTNKAMAESAQNKLASAINSLENYPLSTSLYSGVTGVGFAVALIGEADTSSLLEDLDDLLADALATSNRPNVDIINGIAGLLTYANARCKKGRPSERLCAAIDEAVRRFLGAGGDHYQPQMKDLGVGHGLAGILMACSTSVEQGVIGVDATASIRAGFDDLWKNCVETPFGAILPNSRGLTGHSRVGWCYGSLGGAAAFIQSCRLFPENDGRASLLLKCAHYNLGNGSHGIVDSSVCHGWAGNALLFDHISRLSRDPSQQVLARNAAERCVAEVLKLWVSSGNCFPFRTRNGNRFPTGLLEGSVGVVSATAAAHRGYTPAWAAMLGLTSSPEALMVAGDNR
ncbi:lanthionine synthetase LanC family protein [Stenotrophomonas rhizophila]